MPRQARNSLSYLQAPLDVVLGKASHVRILRCLTESEHPLPPVELARDTRLDLSGVLRALESLAETGIVQTLGVARGRVFQFNSAHYLAPVLQQLFDAERQRRQELLHKLQRAMQAVSPAPRTAWIEGPHAGGHDTAQDTLRVCVLVQVRDRHSTVKALGERLRKIEQKFGLTIELVLRTMADLATLTPEQTESLRTVLLLHGVPPISIVEAGALAPPGPRTHQELDAASQRAAEDVARAVKRDPRVIERAQRWIEQRMPNASEAERHELREWEHILALPPRQVAALLVDRGERATRLRQTSPFRTGNAP